MSSGTGAVGPTAGATGFHERLRCPWSWYVIGAVAGALLAAEIGFVAPVPVSVLMPFGAVVAVVIVVWIGRAPVVVRDHELLVAGARLPAAYVGTVVPLDAATMRRLLGREGDPAAFLATKAWVGPGVQILLDDPDDPVPYWAVSTRRPQDLAVAITGTAPTTGGTRPGTAGTSEGTRSS